MDNPVEIGGTVVPPGTMARVEIPVAMLPTHTMLHLPVTVVNGVRDGARVWLSATLHGDELNGVEIIRRVLDDINPRRVSGLLLAVPIVNVFGFVNQSRYMPDRRDLNRFFPGSTRGSLASRVAALFMKEIAAHCSHAIDLHTAAPPRVNLPQVRANLEDNEIRRCAEAFDAPVTIHSRGRQGTLRAAAAKRGVAILLYEAGEPLRFNKDAIDVGVRGVGSVLRELELLPPRAKRRPRTGVKASRSKWVRALQSGIIYVKSPLGARVRTGQVLGTITDPFGESRLDLKAPFDGIVIGHTNNPSVHRGDGVIHLAVPA